MASVSPSSKPVPVPDDLSRGFWEATAQHTLAMQRCDSCSRYAYPPALVCTACRADPPRFHWEPISGEGHVKTWTVMRDSFLPGFDDDIPYVVADVELAEQPGLRIIAQLRDVAEGDLELGMSVTVAFEDVGEGISVPYFVRSAQ